MYFIVSLVYLLNETVVSLCQVCLVWKFRGQVAIRAFEFKMFERYTEIRTTPTGVIPMGWAELRGLGQQSARPHPRAHAHRVTI